MKQVRSYDLIVAGGGFAGCAAAVAAAREGLRVLLLEQCGYLGGAACRNYVNPFMPYVVRQNGEWKSLTGGLFNEILARLHKKEGFHRNGYTFNEEILKLVLDELLEEAGVEVLFHVRLCGVEVKCGKLRAIEAAGNGQRLCFAAETFVDATGDGELAALAGCRYQLGRESDGLCQPMTLCFRIAGIRMDLYEQTRQEITPLYQQFRAEGKLKNPREDVLIFPHIADGVLHFNSTRVVKCSPVDSFDLSRAEREARQQMYDLYCFLKENFEAFRESVLLASAPAIGARESRKILGEYVLTMEDLKACRKFEDGIAACNYDIDIHNPEGTGTSHYFFPQGEYYTIPYRCLLPRDAENLLVAGRCISSTHEAQASYRIMPVCCSLGEAAGTAAAVAAKAGVCVKKAQTDKIRQQLLHQGGFL